jgi:uncharacterized ferritin-like protein (DUF455 family)
MFRRACENRGGRVGEYPVLNFQYRIIVAVDSLVGRLTVQNRSFEAGGIDAVETGIADALRESDDELRALFEAQLADEVQHVRFANAAIAALRARDPKHLLQMGAALSQAAKAFREVMGREGTEGAHVRVATEARREAGFGREEIRAADELAERFISGRTSEPPWKARPA